MSIERLFIDMETKANVKDSWASHLGEFDSEARMLVVKTSDGKHVRLREQVNQAWEVAPSTPPQRENLFQVEMADKKVVSFSCSSKDSTEHWIQVI